MSCLHLIRHGEPAIRDVLLGATDPPLTAGGKAAASRLRELKVEAVYTSPRLRARETAEVFGRPALVIPEFAEINFGEWDGLAWSEVEERWPSAARAKADDWLGVAPPGGESWPAFLERVRKGLDQVHMFPAAIVAHLVVNSAITHLIDGRDALQFQQSYCEVITIDVSNSFLFRRSPADAR
jgi:broad specificity phosphatase PhoE